MNDHSFSDFLLCDVLLLYQILELCINSFFLTRKLDSDLLLESAAVHRGVLFISSIINFSNIPDEGAGAQS